MKKDKSNSMKERQSWKSSTNNWEIVTFMWYPQKYTNAWNILGNNGMYYTSKFLNRDSAFSILHLEEMNWFSHCESKIAYIIGMTWVTNTSVCIYKQPQVKLQ